MLVVMYLPVPYGTPVFKNFNCIGRLYFFVKIIKYRNYGNIQNN